MWHHKCLYARSRRSIEEPQKTTATPFFILRHSIQLIPCNLTKDIYFTQLNDFTYIAKVVRDFKLKKKSKISH